MFTCMTVAGAFAEASRVAQAHDAQAQPEPPRETRAPLRFGNLVEWLGLPMTPRTS